MNLYFEDADNVRHNRVTLLDGADPVFEAVLSVKFSNEDATEPVTLEEAKDWCAIDGNDSDAKVNMLIKAARKKVESVKQTSFINRTVEAKIKPGTNLPYGPVRSITSITGISGETFDKLEYASEDVVVIYEAGPGEDPLDDMYKVQILQQLAFMLENRGDERAGSGPISPMINPNISRLPTARIK